MAKPLTAEQIEKLEHSELPWTVLPQTQDVDQNWARWSQEAEKWMLSSLDDPQQTDTLRGQLRLRQITLGAPQTEDGFASNKQVIETGKRLAAIVTGRKLLQHVEAMPDVFHRHYKRHGHISWTQRALERSRVQHEKAKVETQQSRQKGFREWA